MKKKYKSMVSFFMAVLLVLPLGLPVAAASLISDPNLEELIRTQLYWVPEDQELSEENLSALYNIYGNEEGDGIQSLSGLEKATELSGLSLPNNSIFDLTPLKNLENLDWVDLRKNNINDISSLSNIANGSFIGLDLSFNHIIDINALKDLTQTYELNLSNNNIADINALKGLTVGDLNLSSNNITDINALSDVVIDRGELYLANNQISNIDALGSMTVTDYVYLDISGNQIQSLDALKNIKVTKLFANDNEIESIENLSGLNLDTLELNSNKLTSLEGLTVVEDVYYNFEFSDNNLSDISVLENIQNGHIDLSNNYITDITALQNMQAPADVNLKGNPLDESAKAIIATLTARGVEVMYDAITPIQREVERVKGSNRQATAVEISKQGWVTADTVIISRGDDFPDALSGAALAYSLDAPILLTGNGTLTEDTSNEITRLKAKKAIILGGTGAIPASVEDELENLGLEVERIAGKNRYETAKLISNRLGVQSDTAIVAYGYNFPDALAVAAYAAKNHIPILLTAQNSIPVETQEVLSTKTKTIVVGGKSAVSEQVFNQLPGAKRISGADRFETAANLIKELNMNSQKVLVANGRGFADALTGSVLAAKMDAPLVLVEKDSLPESISRVMISNNVNDVLVLGGTAAVSDSVVNQLSGN